jgi:hypothetical protein
MAMAVEEIGRIFEKLEVIHVEQARQGAVLDEVKDRVAGQTADVKGHSHRLTILETEHKARKGYCGGKPTLNKKTWAAIWGGLAMAAYAVFQQWLTANGGKP